MITLGQITLILFEGALLIFSNMGIANKHMIKNIYDSKSESITK
jgi:hypothetical protein